MTDKWKLRLTGAAGGLINGLFGGGGGMAVVPLLAGWCGLAEKQAFATCVAVILPVCCVSAAVYLWQARPAVAFLLPYLLGGAVGGVVGGLTFRWIPVAVLRVIFGIFLLYGGVRYLL